ncbi:P-loop containing nucleoside triphosphate hydrolase protein [Nadsonia fulvescens var. elongata DSM 6958]|uniref:RNA helicase n=1 Tax=Nadsonia fulvescens var. elongata DSM 6958 TaxID=857566 RepID=A0A1E3PK94_9ASCO|nr:P-loop containing nucleoside triphosphate hydrolase protein [Nadsonia fulvescens var. elongata DSM 6958]
MAKYRKRFNDKARSGALSKQEKLRRARAKQFNRTEESTEDQAETSEVLLPLTQDEKDSIKRKLQELVQPEADDKVSRSKRKRLEKYVEKQLKREERQVLLKKLGESTFDTSLLKSSKTLGSGRDTKKEKIMEALALEQKGLGNDETAEILYEEREVKEWDADEYSNFFNGSNATAEEIENSEPIDTREDDLATSSNSVFIDYRPKTPVGTTGFGFPGLAKLPKKQPVISKRSYKWRAKMEAEKAAQESEDYDETSEGSNEEFEESQESDDNSESSEEQSLEGSDEENEEDGEEWSGFSDTDPANKVEVEENTEEEEGIKEEISGEENSDEESGESEEESDEEECTDSFALEQSKGKSFAQWAEIVQREQDGSGVAIETPKFEGTYIPVNRPEDTEKLPTELVVPSGISERKSFFVQIERDAEIQDARLKLPVVSEEQRIMEAINNNDCIVICGETGSGKTTQVPQFLFEAGFGNKDSDTPGMIGITQPRRVAAVSMATRVGSELGNHGDKVAHQIRFDSNVKEGTAVKFMTDGVLLRELSADFTLSKYSAIIIDEAHERNINTDILIGVLSRVMKLRQEMSTEANSKIKPLKLIIMSATLRVSDFTENTSLFDTPPPVLKVDARQYPVSVHFNRRSAFNYLEEVQRKATKIHQKLPPGGILIFLTGQQEITTMVKKLRKAFPTKKTKSNINSKVGQQDISTVRVNAKDAAIEAEDIEFGTESKIRIKDDDLGDDYNESEDEEGFDETLEDDQDANAPLHVLPLYSLLPTKEQMKVFENPPDGSRLCIIATNVAETSLTIPGIRYVVDCGRAKERVYDEETGVQSFAVNWVSKASAGQRAGRAGRTGPGHCYRIYSSAVFESDFAQFSKPEILRTPVEGVVLQMKSMGIDKIINFPFPTPPDRLTLAKAEKLLQYLGAISPENNLTDLGRTMSLFPLSPRFAKMLIIANQHGCLPYVIAIVAGLTVGDPFINEHELGIAESSNNGEEEDVCIESAEEKEFKRKLRGKYYKVQDKFSSLDKNSDALKLLCATCAFDYDKDTEEFAKKNFLRFKTMEEIQKLRKQLAYIVTVNTKPESLGSLSLLQGKLKPPTAIQVKAMKQMIAAGFLDQIAIRAELVSSDIPKRNHNRVINVPYNTLFPSTTRGTISEADRLIDPFVYIHPSSVLANTGSTPPDYVVYNTINLSQSVNGEGVSKIRMKPLTDIGPAALGNISKNTSLLTYSKPLGPPYGPKNITLTKRECWVVPRIGAAIGSGGVGWDLPPVKVVQEKEGVHWVVK